jgi:hypothetical protein
VEVATDDVLEYLGLGGDREIAAKVNCDDDGADEE